MKISWDFFIAGKSYKEHNYKAKPWNEMLQSL